MAFRKISPIKKKEPAQIKDPAQLSIGHYTPIPDDIKQSRLPIDKAINYDRVPEKDRYRVMRVVMYNPAEAYSLAGPGIDPYARQQTSLSIDVLFPTRTKGVCACGCERTLTGRRRRWYDDDCKRFALHVYWILYGATDIINYYLDVISGDPRVCMGCSEIVPYDTPHVKRGAYQCEHTFETDHILPVCLGGGGSWLSNYQRLCIPCHIAKTKIDGTNRKNERKSLTNVI